MITLDSITDAAVADDPYPFYRSLRESAPVHYDRGVDAYLLSTYRIVASVYRDPRFSTRSYEGNLSFIHGRTVLAMDGAEHVKNRALLTPHFRGRALEGLTGLIARTADGILDGIAQRRAELLADRLADAADPDFEVDLVAEFTKHYPAAVIADMLGLPEQDITRFALWYGDIIEFVGNLADDPGIRERGLAAKGELERYMLPLIAARRADPGPDLISALVQAEIDGERMDDVGIKSYISLLLTAGGETTDKALGSMLKNLLLNPEQLGAVRSDRSLVPAAIAETLRFAPPSQITSRQAEEDVVLGDTEIPAGSRLLILTGSANRDADRWADPDRFDLHRTDVNVTRAFSAAADHLAFGNGRHFCLGAMLAKAEMECGLNLLLDRFPDLRLAPHYEPVDVGLKTRGPRDVRVRLA